jgi:hypothetical protein
MRQRLGHAAVELRAAVAGHRASAGSGALKEAHEGREVALWEHGIHTPRIAIPPDVGRSRAVTENGNHRVGHGSACGDDVLACPRSQRTRWTWFNVFLAIALGVAAMLLAYDLTGH